MLPPPAVIFTIPSIHDDLVLDCRVYHPTCLAPTKVSQVEDWHKKAAIVAHPYAPLGGSYDDPIVERIASTILKQGFVVGTFNFRGAGSSKGKTSWQSKAEQKDYISFIGFMAYYIHLLSTPPILPPPIEQPRFIRSDTALHDLTPVPSQSLPPPHISDGHFLSPKQSSSVITKDLNGHKKRPRLLLAGYSYGAMVTCSLPAILSSILAPFQTPEPGTAHAEIRLRAQNLATQQNEYIHAQITEVLQIARHNRGRSLQMDDLFSSLTSPRSRKPSSSVRMGGDEDIRRASHDSYRSRSSFSVETQERVRKSVDRVRSFTKASRFHTPRRTNSSGSWASFKSGEHGSNASLDRPKSEHKAQEETDNYIKEIPEILEEFQAAYLLISPLQGLVNSLATMWTYKPAKEREALPEPEFKFTVDPTMALFGDDDVFVSVKRLRNWAGKLEKAGKENKRNALVFRYREVKGAGHFWHDHDALEIMKEQVHDFVAEL